MTDTTSIIALVLSLTLSLGALAVLVRAQRDKAERLQKALNHIFKCKRKDWPRSEHEGHEEAAAGLSASGFGLSAWFEQDSLLAER